MVWEEPKVSVPQEGWPVSPFSTLKKKTGYHIHNRKVARSNVTQSYCPTVVRQVNGGKARN